MLKKDIPKEIFDLARDAFDDVNFEIEEFDCDRIYINRNNKEYIIRTWDFTDSNIRWTLFRIINEPDGSSYGEDEKNGVYFYDKRHKKGHLKLIHTM